MKPMRTTSKIRVLVVEDSPVVRELLVHLLTSDPEIEVVGTADNGKAAVEAVPRVRPDVITMDIHMPVMDGFEASRKIMETFPTPIVIVTGTSATEVSATFRALEAGALALLEKPSGLQQQGQAAKEIIQTVKLMSEVPVVRRWSNKRGPGAPLPAELGLKPKVRLVAIGASTGGPVVLQTILSALPKDFPVPIVVVQHLADGFTGGFVHWLAKSSALHVHVAADGELLLPGHVYVAPDGLHLRVNGTGRVMLSQDEREHGLRPAVSCLFRSVAVAYGPDAVGVLLTGMGRDGACELKEIREQGAVTIAQDEESSVVYGMPGQAVKLGGAMHVLPPDEIAAALIRMVERRDG